MSGMTAGKRWMSVLWSAFLVAAVLEMMVFAVVDPANLHWLGGEAIELSPRAVYTLAFFLFWAVSAVGAALALLLVRPADEINRDGQLDLPSG